MSRQFPVIMLPSNYLPQAGYVDGRYHPAYVPPQQPSHDSESEFSSEKVARAIYGPGVQLIKVRGERKCSDAFINQVSILIDKMRSIPDFGPLFDGNCYAHGTASFNTSYLGQYLMSLRDPANGLYPGASVEQLTMIKEKLERLCFFYIVLKNENHAKTNDITKQVKKIPVCGPGAFEKLLDVDKSITDVQPTLNDWLAELRETILKKTAAVMMEKKQAALFAYFHRQYPNESAREINARVKEMEIHMQTALRVQARDVYGFNIPARGEFRDPHIQTLQLDDRDYAEAFQFFQKEYAENAVQFVVNELRRLLIAAFNKRKQNHATNTISSDQLSSTLSDFEITASYFLKINEEDGSTSPEIRDIVLTNVVLATFVNRGILDENAYIALGNHRYLFYHHDKVFLYDKNKSLDEGNIELGNWTIKEMVTHFTATDLRTLESSRHSLVPACFAGLPRLDGITSAEIAGCDTETLLRLYDFLPEQAIFIQEQLIDRLRDDLTNTAITVLLFKNRQPNDNLQNAFDTLPQNKYEEHLLALFFVCQTTADIDYLFATFQASFSYIKIHHFSRVLSGKIGLLRASKHPRVVHFLKDNSSAQSLLLEYELNTMLDRRYDAVATKKLLSNPKFEDKFSNLTEDKQKKIFKDHIAPFLNATDGAVDNISNAFWINYPETIAILAPERKSSICNKLLDMLNSSDDADQLKIATLFLKDDSLRSYYFTRAWERIIRSGQQDYFAIQLFQACDTKEAIECLHATYPNLIALLENPENTNLIQDKISLLLQLTDARMQQFLRENTSAAFYVMQFQFNDFLNNETINWDELSDFLSRPQFMGIFNQLSDTQKKVFFEKCYLVLNNNRSLAVVCELLSHPLAWEAVYAYLDRITNTAECANLAGQLLHEAIAQQDLEKVNRLLTKKPLLTVEKDGKTLLSLALHKNNAQAVTLLLNYRAKLVDDRTLLDAAENGKWEGVFAYLASDKVFTEQKRRIVSQLLHEAVKQDDPSSLERLLNYNCCLSIDETEQTKKTLVQLALGLNHWDCITEMVKRYYYDHHGGADLLLRAAMLNKSKVVITLLDRGVNTRHCTRDGEYPGYHAIHFAIHHDDIMLLKAILKKRHTTDANLQLSEHHTPLSLALCNNNAQAVSLLLNYGATLSATLNIRALVDAAKKGKWESVFACLDSGEVSRETERYIAQRLLDVIDAEEKEKIKSLLAIEKDGKTFIHRVAEQGHWDYVTLMAHAVKTDANDTANYGHALLLAAEKNQTEAAVTLVAAGASATCRYLAGSHAGYFAVHYAIDWNNINLLRAILEKHSATAANIQLDNNHTPLSLALCRNNAQAVSLLLTHGATLSGTSLLDAACNQKWESVFACLDSDKVSSETKRDIAKDLLDTAIAQNASEKIGMLFYALETVTTNQNWIDVFAYLDSGKVSNEEKRKIAGQLLHVAIARNYTEKMEILLTKKPLLTIEKDGKTPIQRAAELNLWGYVTAIATKQATTDLNDSAKYSDALLKAAKNNQTEAALALIKAGAGSVWRYSDGDHIGYFAVHFAIIHEAWPLLIAILKMPDGADAANSQHDRNCITPLSLALRENKAQAVSLLLAHGAIPNRNETQKCTTYQLISLASEVQEQIYTLTREITELRSRISQQSSTSKISAFFNGIADHPKRSEIDKKDNKKNVLSKALELIHHQLSTGGVISQEKLAELDPVLSINTHWDDGVSSQKTATLVAQAKLLMAKPCEPRPLTTTSAGCAL